MSFHGRSEAEKVLNSPNLRISDSLDDQSRLGIMPGEHSPEHSLQSHT
jgi:hypothetical protein